MSVISEVRTVLTTAIAVLTAISLGAVLHSFGPLDPINDTLRAPVSSARLECRTTASASPLTTSTSSSTPSFPQPAQLSRCPAPLAAIGTLDQFIANVSLSTGYASDASYNGACSASSPCTGDITWYATATDWAHPSFCDTVSNGHKRNVLALSHDIMSPALCGKTAVIKYSGRTFTGTVVDKCMGCGSGSIDLSEHLFGEIVPLSVGRVGGVRWWLV